jgi:hypothetical protein
MKFVGKVFWPKWIFINRSLILLAGRPLDPLLRPPVFPVGIVELTLVSLGGIEMGWKYNKALITL